MKLDLLLLGEQVLLDKFKNTASVINIISEVTIQPLPDGVPNEGVVALPWQTQLLLIWVAEAESEIEVISEAKISMNYPGGSLDLTPIKIDFEGQPRCQQRVEVPFFPYAGPGDYTFAIKYPSGGKEQTKTWPILVKTTS